MVLLYKLQKANTNRNNLLLTLFSMGGGERKAIIETATRVIKLTIKASNKVKRIKNYLLKCNLYLYFLI